MSDVDTLTTERLARLRTWATRHSAHFPDLGTHQYDSSCPWCRSDEREPRIVDGHVFDGNAHDLAVELIDEITRLRSLLHLSRHTEMAPARPGVRPRGWGRGTPVQVAGGGPVIWRVAPPDQQDPRSDRVVVTSRVRGVDTALRLRPNELTYVARAALIPDERVHRVGGNRPSHWGTVTLVIPGPTADADPGIFVRWDGMDQGDDGPYPPSVLERPVDVALAYGIGRAVRTRGGVVGVLTDRAGAVVEVTTLDGDATWHHISDVTKRNP